MKIPYTQMDYWVKRDAKDAGKEIGRKVTIDEGISDICKTLSENDDDKLKRGYDYFLQEKKINSVDFPIEEYVGQIRNSLMISLSERSSITGNAYHLFLQDIDFCNWIVSCVKEYSEEHLEYIYKTFNKHPVVFHFPKGSGLYSFLIEVYGKLPIVKKYLMQEDNLNILKRELEKDRFIVNKNLDYYLNQCEHTRLVFSFSCGNKDDSKYLIFNPSGLEKDKIGVDFGDISFNNKEDKASWFIRFVVGIGMYIGCFPEQMIDGIPEDLKHPSHHNNRINKTIKISPKIIERDGPRPHYRSGHFRLLSSDFYKNKKGQVIFIHGTFVKGKVKTILGPDNEVKSEKELVNI